MHPEHQEGHAEVIGAFQHLPPPFPRERPERRGEQPPSGHIQEPGARRGDERQHPQGDSTLPTTGMSVQTQSSGKPKRVK
jgi:hypothetical protein